MALQITGPISFGDIRRELDVSNSPFSIRQAELGNYDTINRTSTSKPNNSSPHSVSEWYGYDHNARIIAPTTWTTFFSQSQVTSQFNQCNTASTSSIYEHDGSGTFPTSGDKIRNRISQNLVGAGYIKINSSQFFGDGIQTDSSGTVIAIYQCGGGGIKIQ